MTPEQIAAIAARNAARTPGKWHKELGDGNEMRFIYVCDTSGKEICSIDDFLEVEGWTAKQEDFDFIAHASEDIPSLLAEVARLTAALAEAEQRGYDAAKEQAKQAVEDAGWYRSSDDAVSWGAQDEQVQYSIAAIAAMVKP